MALAANARRPRKWANSPISIAAFDQTVERATGVQLIRTVPVIEIARIVATFNPYNATTAIGRRRMNRSDAIIEPSALRRSSTTMRTAA